MIATKEINEQSKWIVESTHLRMLPEMEKPKYVHGSIPYDIAAELYRERLASQPTIPRGDNGQWSIGDVKVESVDFDVKYESPDGGFVFDYSDAKEHQQFELFTPIALPKKKQQESEESEDEIWDEVGEILKKTWTMAKVKQQLKQHYSIKRK